MEKAKLKRNKAANRKKKYKLLIRIEANYSKESIKRNGLIGKKRIGLIRKKHA